MKHITVILLCICLQSLCAKAQQVQAILNALACADSTCLVTQMSGSYKSIPPIGIDIAYTEHALLKMHFFASTEAATGQFITNNPTLYYYLYDDDTRVIEHRSWTEYTKYTVTGLDITNDDAIVKSMQNELTALGFILDAKAGSYASPKYPKITVKYTVYKDIATPPRYTATTFTFTALK